MKTNTICVRLSQGQYRRYERYILPVYLKASTGEMNATFCWFISGPVSGRRTLLCAGLSQGQYRGDERYFVLVYLKASTEKTNATLCWFISRPVPGRRTLLCAALSQGQYREDERYTKRTLHYHCVFVHLRPVSRRRTLLCARLIQRCKTLVVSVIENYRVVVYLRSAKRCRLLCLRLSQGYYRTDEHCVRSSQGQYRGDKHYSVFFHFSASTEKTNSTLCSFISGPVRRRRTLLCVHSSKDQCQRHEHYFAFIHLKTSTVETAP